jgi:hypothetical protein
MTGPETQQEVLHMTPETGRHGQVTIGEAGRTATGAWASAPGQPGAAVRAPGSRPSPRPRPTPPPTPEPVADDMTVSNSPISTGDSESAPGGAQSQENGPRVSTLQSSLHLETDTLRDQIRSGLGWLKTYFTPPSVLSEQPASVAELAAYARWGAWTPRTDGFLRNLGVTWYRLIGLPTTVVCRYVEWIAQRPGRAIPVYLLWKLLISTGPGPWVAAHLIHPVLGFVAWVLL